MKCDADRHQETFITKNISDLGDMVSTSQQKYVYVQIYLSVFAYRNLGLAWKK